MLINFATKDRKFGVATIAPVLKAHKTRNPLIQLVETSRKMNYLKEFFNYACIFEQETKLLTVNVMTDCQYPSMPVCIGWLANPY